MIQEPHYQSCIGNVYLRSMSFCYYELCIFYADYQKICKYIQNSVTCNESRVPMKHGCLHLE